MATDSSHPMEMWPNTPGKTARYHWGGVLPQNAKHP